MSAAPPPVAGAGYPSEERLRTLESRLRGAVEGEVRFDRGARALYTSDASNYRILPAAVVAPRSLDDLVTVVALCREAGVPLTMRGAGTSIAGNAIGPGVVVDASRHLDRILSIDPGAQTATVEPGVVLDDLNREAARHGLRFGPDPATHSRCTLGGMIGNNACGSHSVRWGTTADNTLGLEVVTASGSRYAIGTAATATTGGPPQLDPPLEARLRALAERNLTLLRRELPPWPRRVSGYALDWLMPERGFDVARSLVGSEGTCAIVTAATVRLVRPPAVRSLLVLAFEDDVAAASAVTGLLSEHPFTIESLTADLLEGGHDPLGLLPPGGAWLLVETGGSTPGESRDHAGRLAGSLGLRLEDPAIACLEDTAAQQALWRIREDGAGRSARLPDGTPAWPGFEDAAVPPERLPAYLGALHALLAGQGLRGITYGHFGEGCIHLRVAFGLDRPGGIERYASFLEAAADLVVAHGGTLSGEHGDGRARGALLPRMFSPALIALFEQYKAIWDPDGCLNPGVLVEPDPITASLRRPRPTAIALRPALAYEADGRDLRSAVERCIGLGRCVTHAGGGLMCPSFQATRDEQHSTRGRARLLQEMMAGSLVSDGWRSRDVRDALDLCLSCKGCVSECPTGVDMASYKSEFLDHYYRGRLRPRSHYALGWLPAWLRLTRRMPRIVNAFMRFRISRRLFSLAAGMAPERTIPPLARETFVRTFRPAAPSAPARGRVVLWPDTYSNYLTPEVAHAAVRVLGAAGFEVTVPSSPVCCGLTWITTGQLSRARRILRATLAAPGLAGEEPIVVLEPSCAAALRRDVTELLPRDPRAASLSRRVTTLGELLDSVEYTPPGGEPLQALVQPHCHQQAVLGVGPDARVMVRAGIEPSQVLTGCCGLAGNFGAEAGHEAVSRAVAGLALLPALDATAPDSLVMADGFSCRTQIAFLTGRRARHLAEVLADRLEG